MSAAARIVKPGGVIILAAECSDGLPHGSHFEKLLHQAKNPEELIALISTPGFRATDQWSAQIQAIIQRNARVLLHSSLSDEMVLGAHLKPCPDIAAAVSEILAGLPSSARVAVLPQGPLTIPYLG